jgi:hypothetical protein
MKWTIARILCLLGLVASSVGAREAGPAPNCLDARTIERVRTLDENTLVVAAGNGRFIVAHGTGCELQEPASLLAQEGWVCGREREFVRSGDVLCPVTSVTAVDARTYANLAAAADRRVATRHAGSPPQLEAVEVLGVTPRARGFRGDTDYCFAPHAVRGWQFKRNEVVVQTSPRRAGGNRRYRIALAESCPGLDRANAVEFVSGYSIGMICGNPGDRIVPRQENVNGEIVGLSSIPPSASARAFATGCAIAAVFPDD